MTSAALKTRFDQLNLLVKDSLASIGGDAAVTSAFSAALAEFSKDVPRVAEKEFTWDGTVPESLTDWYEDSRVLHVEAPRDAVPPVVVTGESYVVDAYLKTIRMVNVAAGTNVRVRYGAMHVIPETNAQGSTVTIPDSRIDAYLYLVASRLCLSLAARHAEEHKANFSDVTDHSSKSSEYRQLAKEYRRIYRELVGASPEITLAGAEVRTEYELPAHRVFS